jgi:hypothetical protein
MAEAREAASLLPALPWSLRSHEDILGWKDLAFDFMRRVKSP